MISKMINSQSSVQESHKRKACDVEDNLKRIRLDVDNISTSSKDQGNYTIYLKEETYHKGGIVRSLHGIVYQLKLLMLFVHRAVDKKYDFHLGTEVENASKFDDIVFKYKEERGKNVMRCVQIKHKKCGLKKITKKYLLKELQKYFISYRSIKNDPDFSEYELKDFILYTNIGFAGLKEASIKIKKYEGFDDLLDIIKDGEITQRCELIVPKENELFKKLKETSDLSILVEELNHHIRKNKCLSLTVNIFELYHNALCKKIFEFLPNKNAKFRYDFLNSNNKIISNFRKVLHSSLELEFQEKLSQMEFKTSASFRQVFDLQTNPTITDSKGFAKRLAQIIFNAQRMQEYIITNKSIEDDLVKLAGHILVKDESQKQLARFRKLFFDDNQKSKGNLEEFKAALKTALQENDIDFSTLNKYKFKIRTFITCKETPKGELLYKDELPNDNIEDTEVVKFFEKLVFAVNQPNEEELGEIIKKEMGQSSKFNLLDAELVYDSFQKKMLDWLKEKRPEHGHEGVWLNAKSGKMFLNLIEQKVSGLITVGITETYINKLKNYDIKFKLNKVWEKLKDFVTKVGQDGKKILHIIAPKETILTVINVYGALDMLKEQEEFARLKKKDSFIFLNLSSLVDKSKHYIIDAFKSNGSHDLLIVDCKMKIDGQLHDIQSLYKELCDCNLRAHKSIIFIAEEYNALIEQFPNHLISYVKDDISFVHLTEQSKIKLLEKKIIFQGHEVRFNELIDKSDEEANNIIDLGIIVKLLKDHEISIGSQLKGLGAINDYYIHRMFRHVTFSKEQIKKYLGESSNRSDLFVISGNDSGLKHDNIFDFDNDNLAEQMFMELCNEKRECNVHWLKSHTKKFTWFKSYGSISNLISYRIREKDKKTENNTLCLIEENKLITKDYHHKLVIISDTAGMGKSTVLTHLAINLKKKHSSLWVIRINLSDHTKVLYKALNTKKLKCSDPNINDVIDFLSIDILALPQLEKKLFKNSFNSDEKITLLFDGFDEISPDYKDLMIGLLRSLQKSKVKQVIITTRPNMKKDVEQALQVFSLELEPLSKDKQIEFLTKYWTDALQTKVVNINTKKLEVYIKSTIKFISDSFKDNKQGFISIPLQTMMTAEVLKANQSKPSTWQGCEEFLNSDSKKPKLPKGFALLELYESFVKRKFNEFYLEEKKGRDLTKTGEMKSADQNYEIFKENHEVLSLQTLFSETNELFSKQEIKKLEILLKEIKNGEHNVGIVDHIKDDKPHFIHRTFAEYFASFLIAKKMLAAPAKTLKYIDNVVLNMSQIFINTLIENLDGKQEIISSALGKPLLYFVTINHHDNFIKSLLASDYDDWPKKLDSFGKTPLHYASEYGHLDIVKELPYYPNKVEEFKIAKPVTFVNMQDKDGKTALYYAMQRNHRECALELLNKRAKVTKLKDAIPLMENMIPNLTDNDVYKRGCADFRALTHDWLTLNRLIITAPGIFRNLNKQQQYRILIYFIPDRLNENTAIKSLLTTITNAKQKEILKYNLFEKIRNMNTENPEKFDDILKDLSLLFDKVNSLPTRCNRATPGP